MEYNKDPINRPTEVWPTNFDKSAKEIQWVKNNLFNKMRLQELDTIRKKKKL